MESEWGGEMPSLKAFMTTAVIGCHFYNQLSL
jgi:hypothetical protein